jgi:MFS family permease
MYIAEVAKPSIRGLLVSAYSALLMCFGQFAAGIVDGVLAPFDMGWRFMLGFAIVPGTVMFVGFWNPSGITELVGGQCMDDTMKHTRFSKVFGIAMEK